MSDKIVMLCQIRYGMQYFALPCLLERLLWVH